MLERPPRGAVLPKGQEVLIVGAGEGGQLIAREMQRTPRLRQTPIGFVDDDPRKRGMRINGLKVLGDTRQMDRLLDDVEPDEVIIAIPSAPGVLREQVVRACRERDIPVRTLPGVFELISGSVDLMRQVREVQVEDVLGREPVTVEIEQAGAYLRDRIVLVTGAGGSIGPELCRQIARVRPRLLVLLDHAEDNLFDIERELIGERHFAACESILADCKEPERMHDVMERFRPDVVFHAAAYKHVSLTEENPLEAVRNNAIGTRVCAAAAAAAGVRRFVLVSTDKAVNPATALGASKAMAEWIVEALGRRNAEHGLLLRAVRERARLERQRRAAVPPPDRAGRPGDRHASRHGALLHDDPGVGAARDPGGEPGARRRDVRARDGRAGEDHRPRAQHDPAVRPGARRDTDRDRRRAARREAARGAVRPGERAVPTEADRILRAERAAARPGVGRGGLRARRAAGRAARRGVPRPGARPSWPARSSRQSARTAEDRARKDVEALAQQ